MRVSGERGVRVNADGVRIIAARATRSFGYGFLAVVLGVYLRLRGFDATVIGIVFGVMLAAGAGLTVVARVLERRLGRRTQLLLFGGLMAIAGVLLWASTSAVVIAIAAALGVVSPTGTEVGPFLPLEQASLPGTTAERRRTSVFAWFNLAGSLSAAAGALFAGLPAVLAAPGAVRADHLVPLFAAYAALGVLVIVLYAGLSPGIEAAVAPTALSVRSRAVVSRLSALFAVDAFAGGFVLQSFVSYWFFVRWSLPTDRLGVLFFAANVLTSLSFLAAARIATHIGLIRTMVFTHLPSNVLLILVPLVPTAELAVACYLGRMALSQMDVPTRQAYTVGVVAPSERVAAAGYTNIARNVAQSGSPPIAGWSLAFLGFAAPFLLGGGLKILYDLALFHAFRSMPEGRETGSPSPIEPT